MSKKKTSKSKCEGQDRNSHTQESFENPLLVMLPCLRCGLWGVPVSIFFTLEGRDTPGCRYCDTIHYLAVRQSGGQFNICYQRYTLRYPLDNYDEDDPPIAILKAGQSTQSTTESDTFSGPIMVFPRKKRFSRAEVEQIWRASKGRCHICGRAWLLNGRNRDGWHIDHVIPHIGGGADTEELSNLRIACAKCNLKKGRGYTEKQIKLGLKQLIEKLYSAEQQITSQTSEEEDLPDDEFPWDDL